jgi:hypothetical protein
MGFGFCYLFYFKKVTVEYIKYYTDGLQSYQWAKHDSFKKGG